MSRSPDPMSPSYKKTNKSDGPLRNQAVNLKTDYKTLYYSILKLKAQQRLKEICIVKQQP